MIYSILVCAIVRKLFKYSNFYTKVRVFFVYFQRHFGGVLWLQIRKKQEVNNKTSRCFEKCIRTRYNYKCYIAICFIEVRTFEVIGSWVIEHWKYHLTSMNYSKTRTKSYNKKLKVNYAISSEWLKKLRCKITMIPNIGND